MSNREMKDYLSHHRVPALLESLLTGLLFHHPDDPISFLQSCLSMTSSQLGGSGGVDWDSFIRMDRPGPPANTPGPPNSNPLTPNPTPLPDTLTLPETTQIQTDSLTPTHDPTTPSVPLETTHTPITFGLGGPCYPNPDPNTCGPPNITPIPDTLTLHEATHTPTDSLTLTQPKTTSGLSPSAQFLSIKTTLSPPVVPGCGLPKTPPILTITPLEKPGPLILTLSPESTHTPADTLTLTPPKTTARLSPSNQLLSIKTKSLAPLITTHPGSGLSPVLPAGVPIQQARSPEAGLSPGHPSCFSGQPCWLSGSSLSIDSDSDMTERSGLTQEVGITRRPVIFLIGGPGSGKGVQASRLASCFNLRAISLDELLLRHAPPGRKWEVLTQMMSHGQLGAQEEAVSQLKQQLVGPHVSGFIVEGFPRDVHQALSFHDKIGPPDLVMLLLCSNETLRCRLHHRTSQLGLLGDSSPAFNRRVEMFERKIISVKRYYRQLTLLTQVNADRSEDLVFADLESIIREKFKLKDLSDADHIPECSSAHSDVTTVKQ